MITNIRTIVKKGGLRLEELKICRLEAKRDENDRFVDRRPKARRARAGRSD